MDVILNTCDRYFFTPYIYPVDWAEDNIIRQSLSLYVFVVFVSFLAYLSTATLFYVFLYDKRLMQHPQYLKNQISLEIKCAMKSPLLGALLFLPFFVGEIRGFSKLYDNVTDYGGWPFIALSVVSFVMVTDFLVYLAHRGLHHPLVYRSVHKVHHAWKIPTPFSSIAMHPVDAWMQGLPYHIYPYLFPINKYLHLGLFLMVNVWAVSIHDGYFMVPDSLKPMINGAAHHTDHHLYFNYNYGQYFTLWDRIFGSFRDPTAYEGKSPLDEVIKNNSK